MNSYASASHIRKLSQKETGPVSRARVAVVGARGYSGLELCRLLLAHPAAELKAAFATSRFDLATELCLETDEAKAVPCFAMDAFEQELEGLQTVFLATPAEVSMELAPKALARGINVIDLSGAFRLNSGTAEERLHIYSSSYGLRHSEPEWLSRARFGLVPWAKPISLADGPALIANPGCYATATLMALLPLLHSGEKNEEAGSLIVPETVVVDGKSGTTGGGRKASEHLLFSEVDGECLAYKPGTHQHLPEISHATGLFAGLAVEPFFTTHLLSARRGIVISLYARLQKGLTAKEADLAVEKAFAKAYGNYPLASWASADEPRGASYLRLRNVVGTPRTRIAFKSVGDKLYVFSLIDNLLKGAAAQAVENFNLLLDMPVDTGLTGWGGGA